MLKFVDNTKVIAGIKNEDYLIKFQEELEPIYQWSDKNNMSWNNSKFKELRFGARKDLDDCLLLTPGYLNVLLPEMAVKDLGILVDHKLSFKDQRDSAIKKAKNKASWF